MASALEYEIQGKKKKGGILKTILIIILAIIGIVGFANRFFARHQKYEPSPFDNMGTAGSTEVGLECKKMPDGVYRCGKDEDWEKAKLVKNWHYAVKTFKASISKYSRTDSCHNPKWVRGKRECITAAGHDTRAGYTVACPRNIPLGRNVEIARWTFRCDDRTAKWVEEKFGPTFDIFTEDQQEAIAFGRRTQEVTVYYQ